MRGISEYFGGGLIGEKNRGVGAAQDDADMEIFDEGAEALFIIAKDILGFDSGGDIADNNKGAGTAIEFGDHGGHLTAADVT